MDLDVRRVCVGIGVGVLAGYYALPQAGPMPVVCDGGVPPFICEDMRNGWQRVTDLPRSRIVRIEYMCVGECNHMGGEGVIRAVLTDGTTTEIGASSWVP